MIPTKTLKQLRADRGLTSRELAGELGVSLSAVSAWETGYRTPPLRMALRIARFFGVPLEEIRFPCDPDPTPPDGEEQRPERDPASRKEAAS